MRSGTRPPPAPFPGQCPPTLTGGEVWVGDTVLVTPADPALSWAPATVHPS